MSLSIRRARREDSALIFALLHELADYEKLTHELVATEAGIAEALFAGNQVLSCEIAEWENKPAGFAIWFFNFPTFAGRRGLYLEDLFVRPAFRGKGIGKGLLAHLANLCVENGWSRMQWSVLDWNTPSIDFYKSLGAEMMDEWKLCKIAGTALSQLAKAKP